MNKFIKILESIGIAIIMILIICAFMGLVLVIILPFVTILCVGISVLANIVGEWIILGIAISIVIIYFAREIYRNI